MNERAVACALIVDAAQKILVVQNPHWQNQFAIPTRQVDPDTEPLGAAALDAAREDLGMALPDAHFVPLGYLGTAGLSGRTDETTLYHYWVFRVFPGKSFTLPAGRARLQSAAEIADAPDVTWSTKHIVEAIFQNQEAALAIITRPGRTQTEYLVLWNDNYEGFFFPAARVTAEFPAATVARGLVRAELGYRGPIIATERSEVPEFQFSPRWGHARGYRFHLVSIEFPPHHDEVIDLHRPLGQMQELLHAAEVRRGRGNEELPAGWSYRWLTADELRSPPLGVQFTQTMAAVVPTVLASFPPVVRPLRRSEGGIAFIHGKDRFGRPGWLAQWNEGWGGYFLIGGHREAGETFTQCVVRETREELGIPDGEPDGFTVGAALPALRYVAWSKSADQYTDYEMHAFDVALSPQCTAAVAATEHELHLRWLSNAEIVAQQTTAGQRISETVRVLLHLAGQL